MKWIAWTLLACGLVACGDPASVDAPTDAGAADALADAADAGTACPGSAGCACQAEADCPVWSACVPTDGGLRCAVACEAGACAQGFACTTVLKTDAAGNPKQVGNLCVARWPTACDPCTASAGCAAGSGADAACVALGTEGAFCAPVCATAADCPTGYGCQDTATVEGKPGKRCLPVAGTCTCSPAAISTAKATACTVGAAPDGTGGCAGTRQCGSGGLSACDAAAPATETCNGADDDCDGTIDGPGLCADDDACTDDACAGGAGCSHTANTAACDDGDACTTGDACAAGQCQGAAVACDDGNPCTDDACGLGGACTATANSAPCNDNDPCTGPDQCLCAPGAPGGATCACQGPPTSCDDGNPCTDDSCLPGQGCDHAFNALPCDDGNACTAQDACNLAKCVGDALVCDDGYACTLDQCDPVQACVFGPGTDPTCGKATLPYVQPFQCGGAGVAEWLLSGGAQDGVRWQVAPVPGLPADATACALQAWNGQGLGCGAGQATVQVLAESPELDATGLPAGSTVVVRLLSAGSWPAGAKATLQLGIGGLWTDVASVPPSGLVWGKVQAPLAGAVGQKIKVRLQFSAPCGSAGTGWKVRDFAVFHDACLQANGGCAAEASCEIGAQGLPVCQCFPGFAGDGQTCADVDECATGAAGCHADATCSNGPGSFTCACKPGFAGDGKACLDVDECATGAAGCHADATCSNSAGSFTCACKPGYSGDGQSCQDVDECQTGAAGCSAQASCANAPGSYACTCKAGYAGDGKACTDVDECANGSAGCHAQATCSNTAGSFSCTCKAGWLGNGKQCVLFGGPESPAPSCLAILQGNPKAGSGNWWLDPDGAGAAPKQQYFCDMQNGGWTRITIDTFETGADGWSPGGRSTCGPWGWILGGYGLVNVGPLYKTFTKLPPHSSARVRVEYVRIDSWDGEEGQVFVDGNKIWGKNMYFNVGQQLCGAGAAGWLEEKSFVDQVLAHGASQLQIVAKSTLNQDPSDESFGIDNVELWVK